MEKCLLMDLGMDGAREGLEIKPPRKTKAPCQAVFYGSPEPHGEKKKK